MFVYFRVNQKHIGLVQGKILTRNDGFPHEDLGLSCPGDRPVGWLWINTPSKSWMVSFMEISQNITWMMKCGTPMT
jgi:hypothetical protein